MDKERIRLALGVLSGRRRNLGAVDLERLGYDPYKFGYYGSPSEDEIREKAEDIIFDALTGEEE